jgi:hypothetical protein
MSIYSAPYPADGVDYCPTKTIAEIIAQIAYDIDGPTAIAEITDFFAMESVDGRQQLVMQCGIGDGGVRRRIAKVWSGMSHKAKAHFFRDQYNHAAAYAMTCLRNIRNELGEIDVEINLPPSDRIIAKWLS